MPALTEIKEQPKYYLDNSLTNLENNVVKVDSLITDLFSKLEILLPEIRDILEPAAKEVFGDSVTMIRLSSLNSNVVAMSFRLQALLDNLEV